ncbi:urotensin 1 [Boleophthalmus pectinirostris]|uniref:urotensin 1 n=1 Tax=Boleophthalmus pectinirostris TaxID=150288 RepID=UPI00242BB5F9|nr:urotensin 1 [Boleophthalmus pectinirostris]
MNKTKSNDLRESNPQPPGERERFSPVPVYTCARARVPGPVCQGPCARARVPGPVHRGQFPRSPRSNRPSAAASGASARAEPPRPGQNLLGPAEPPRPGQNLLGPGRTSSARAEPPRPGLNLLTRPLGPGLRAHLTDRGTAHHGHGHITDTDTSRTRRKDEVCLLAPPPRLLRPRLLSSLLLVSSLPRLLLLLVSSVAPPRRPAAPPALPPAAAPPAPRSPAPGPPAVALETDDEAFGGSEKSRRDEPPLSIDLTFHLLRNMIHMAKVQSQREQALINRKVMDEVGK